MSGPIPINPVNVRPDVIQPSGGGSQDLILQALLQAPELFFRARQQRDNRSATSQQHEIQLKNIELEKQRIAIEQEKEKRLTIQQQAELERTKAEGGAIQSIMKELAPFMVQNGQAGQLQGMMGMQPQQPMQQGMPQGVPGPGGFGVQPQTMQWGGPQPPSGAGSPLGALLNVLSGTPADAVPGVLKQAMPVVQTATTAQAHAAQLRSVESAIQSAPPEKQGRLRALYTLTDANKDLPKEVLRGLFPDFFSQNEPETVNAFTTAFRTGSFTAGQAARMVGMVLPTDIDSNTKYPLEALLGRGTGAARQTEIQSKAANFLGMMQSTAPLIDELIEKTGGVSFMAELKKNQKPGGGLFATALKAGVNSMLSEDQQKLVTAMQNFSNAWRFAISGASSSDKEFEQIMNSTVEAVGDGTETKRLKRNLRQMMILGVEDIANGHRTRAQVLQQALKMDWDKGQKEFLQKQLQDAVQYEVKIKNGTDPFIPETAPPGSAAALQKQLDDMAALIRASTMGVRP